MSMSKTAVRADLSPNCGRSWIYEIQCRDNGKIRRGKPPLFAVVAAISFGRTYNKDTDK